MQRLAVLAWMIVLLASGCRPKNQYTSKPVGTGNEAPEVKVTPYHVSDAQTDVYIEISNANLLYKRPDSSRAFYAHLRVLHELSGENPKRVIDSSSYSVNDLAAGEQVPVRMIYSRFSVPAVRGFSYTLAIDLFDINRRTRTSKTLVLDKLDQVNEQNFLVLVNDTVAFTNHFERGDTLQLRYAHASGQLHAEYFAREFGPALPPFSTKEPEPLSGRPDSSFSLEPRNGLYRIVMPGKGFYCVKADASQQQGRSLFTFDSHFPSVGNVAEMTDCARYIMSREEFEACKTADDQKAAIDKFWVGIGGSNERARELLKRYYLRVQEANRYFSSYCEGWKTDRGMIFIVFGQPANVYKSKKDEVWVYGNEANPAALRFVFNRVKNPYSENDFLLERSQFYKDPWYNAVDYWRQGHVYSDGRR